MPTLLARVSFSTRRSDPARACVLVALLATCLACGKSAPPTPAPESAPAPEARDIAAAAPAPDRKAQSMPTVDFDREIALAENCFELALSGPGEWSASDVVLLESEEPVVFEARAETTGTLPASFRLEETRVVWEVSAGSIVEKSDAPGGSTLRWAPPADSLVCDVTATLIATLQPAGRAADPRPAIVRKTASFRLLTSMSSAPMSDGFLAGYNLGRYPVPGSSTLGSESKWPTLHPDRYRIPQRFYRIATDDKPLRISPRVTLGHFVIDYPWGTLGMPQLVAIDLNLVRKIEDLIDLMQSEGRFPVTGIVPIYGFRPPSFNQESIKGRPDTNLKVEYSMHQYGRAMDFIVDEDGDLVMDDLNGDGISDIRDAAEIMRSVNILDRRYRDEGRWEMVGGAGIYEFHDFVGRPKTPYLHMDTRGFQSDSGTLIRWKEPPPAKWPDGTDIRWGAI